MNTLARLIIICISMTWLARADFTASFCRSTHYPESMGFYTPSAPTVNLARGEVENLRVYIHTDNLKELTCKTSVPDKSGLSASVSSLEYYLDYQDVVMPERNGKLFREQKDLTALLTIRTARDARPGIHKVILTLGNDAQTSTFQIPVRVFPFKLPVCPTFPWVAAIFDQIVPMTYQCDLNSKAGAAIVKQWIDKALDYRISPHFWGDGEYKLKGYYPHHYVSPYPVDDPRTEKILSDPRLAAFPLPLFRKGDKNFGDLRKILPLLRKHNWLPKTYAYFLDENPRSQYEEFRETASAIHAIEPSIRVLMAYYLGPDGTRNTIQELPQTIGTQYAQIHSISFWSLNRQENLLNAMRKRYGIKHMWPYVCNGPWTPEPNFLFIHNGYQHRAVMWRAWKEGADGFLYWGLNVMGIFNRSRTKGNMADVRNFKNPKPDGDGLLMYPAEGYYRIPLDSCKGKFLPPLASIRLETLRDSLEDLEMLEAYSKRFGRAKACRVLSKVYDNPCRMTANPKALEDFRLTLLKALD